MPMFEYHEEFCATLCALVTKAWLPEDQWLVKSGNWIKPQTVSLAANAFFDTIGSKNHVAADRLAPKAHDSLINRAKAMHRKKNLVQRTARAVASLVRTSNKKKKKKKGSSSQVLPPDEKEEGASGTNGEGTSGEPLARQRSVNWARAAIASGPAASPDVTEPVSLQVETGADSSGAPSEPVPPPAPPSPASPTPSEPLRSSPTLVDVSSEEEE